MTALHVLAAEGDLEVPRAAELLVVGFVLLMVVVGAVVVGADARRLGRRPLPWVLLVLLTGPVGVVAYVVARTTQPTA
jgi:hypothetical protein